jgi:hypothetical protein
VKLNPGLPWQKQHSIEGRFFTSKQDLNLRKGLAKRYISNIALSGAETWPLRKVDQKYLEVLKRGPMVEHQRQKQEMENIKKNSLEI